MPKENENLQIKLQRAEAHTKFLADRMAILLVDISQRDMDFGECCYEGFYVGVDADISILGTDKTQNTVAVIWITELVIADDPKKALKP